ncbi:MAG: MaoC family dehydratase N-terminal domain-containing protein [Acidimicrobiia bacterium]
MTDRAETDEQREKRVGARIDDEQLDKLRAKVGYALGYTYQWNEVATQDAIRHFAHGCGDDNPMWCDPGYGATTRWGTTLAPPLFYMTMGEDQSPPLPPEVKEASRGALSGVHLFHAGTEIEWGDHIRPDDTLDFHAVLADVEVKESEFAGQTVITHHELDWTNQHGRPVVFQHEWFVRAERRKAAQTGKFDDYEEAHYTDDDLTEIDAQYAREEPRGDKPRWWEDVKPGDEIDQRVKGPLTTTDIIAMHSGWGWGGYNFGPLRLGYKHRQKMPNFWTKNRHGAWDVVQRLHWEDDWAAEVGAPFRYDYGFMRTAWMIQAVTDWMGDDAFLWRFWNRLDRFNFIGDTTWVRGRVKDVREESGHRVADVALSCVDQRDETTAHGDATVILPSRDAGPVEIPNLTRDRRH